MNREQFDKYLEPARKKIHGVSPESIALRRVRHPEEFYGNSDPAQGNLPFGKVA